jgi:hypothetical protein
MLVTLLIAVPLGLALAVAIDLASGRGDHVEGWIDDAHPVLARPSADEPEAAVARPVARRRPSRPTRTLTFRAGRKSLGARRRVAARH